MIKLCSHLHYFSFDPLARYWLRVLLHLLHLLVLFALIGCPLGLAALAKWGKWWDLVEKLYPAALFPSGELGHQT